MSLSPDRADVIIVGSGPTGSAYARTIADAWPAAHILMLEAGPIVSDPPGHHVSNFREPAKQEAAEIASQGPNRSIRYAPITEDEWRTRISGRPDGSMLRRPGLFAVGHGELDGDGFPAAHAASNVGGMGAHWFGGCPRPAVSERVPFIDPDIMNDALSKGEALLCASAGQYPDSPIAPVIEEKLGKLFNGGRPVDRFVQPMPMALVRTPDGWLKSGVDVILGDLLTSASDRFELRPDTVCTGICLDGDRASAVETRDMVTGEARRIEAGTVVVAADSLHTPQLLYASGIRPKALGRTLNEHFQVSLMVEMDDITLGDAPGGVMWIPYLDESFPYSVTIAQAMPAMLPFGAPGAAPDKPCLFVSLFSCSDLLFENCVTFSDQQRDWRGLPALTTYMKPSADDLQRIAAAKKIGAQIADTLGRQLPNTSAMRPPFGSSLHYQGTIRMGEHDDGMSVCDRNSRVWGLDNVYVAGNGVIPTKTGTNPTLTSVALAVLGARDIAQRNA